LRLLSLVCFGIIFWTSCSNNSSNQIYYSYLLDYQFAKNLDIESSQRYETGQLADGSFISFLYSTKSNLIHVYSISSDTLLSTISLPESFGRIKSIDIEDSTNFAVASYSNKIGLYRNGQFISKDISNYTNEHLMAHHCDVEYLSSQNIVFFSIIRTVFDTTFEREKQFDLIGMFDFKNDKFSVVPIKYPEIYLKNDLPQPHYWIRAAEDRVIVSFEFDPFIYIYLPKENGRIEKLEFKPSTYSMTVKLPSDKMNKAARQDSLMAMSAFHNGFGPAFYDTTSKTYLRIYRPTMPRKDQNGVFLNSTKQSCSILKKQGNNVYQYLLPNGVYYVSESWDYCLKESELIHTKFFQHDKENKDNSWFQGIYIHKLYNF